MKKDTSEREREALTFIRSYMERHGIPPTIREIAGALGIRSLSMVHALVKRIEEAGQIRNIPHAKRAIRLTSPVPRRGIPVIGHIPAGTPITAVEDFEEVVPLDPAWFSSSGDAFFALRVQGDSMIGEGVLEGDLVVIRVQDTAEDGEIVAALIEGIEHEATLKVFRRVNDHVELRPANPRYAPFVFTAEDLSAGRLRILGVMAGLIRRGR